MRRNTAQHSTAQPRLACSKSLNVHPLARKATVVIVQTQAIALDVGRILVFGVVVVEEEAGVAVMLSARIHLGENDIEKVKRCLICGVKCPSRRGEIKTYKLLPASSLIPFPLRFLLGVISLLVPLLLLETRPPMVFSFLGVDFGFLGVVLAERTGGGRSPELASAFKAAASLLMMRKRPSMES